MGITKGIQRVKQTGFTIQETVPTDSTNLNGSIAITEVTVGTVTTKTIVKTIGAVAYQKTVVSDSSDNSVSVSAWSVI